MRMRVRFILDCATTPEPEIEKQGAISKAFPWAKGAWSTSRHVNSTFAVALQALVAFARPGDGKLDT